MTATAVEVAPAPATDRTERRGWLAVGAITAAVAASWAQLLAAPLGDNHLGRVIGRYALHMRNLHQDGLLGSRFSADWAPYAGGPYAHHPPLLNLLDALFTTALPGDGVYQLRIAPYLLALLAIPAAAGLLRGLGIRWLPTLLAAGAMVVTGFYWVYSPIMFDLGPILALAAVVVRLRHRPDPSRRLVALGCAAALLATLGSWPGIAFAAVLILWLLAGARRPPSPSPPLPPRGSLRPRTRRLDRTTAPVAAAAVAGLAVSLAFMVGVHGTGVLAEQTELRAAGGSFTAADFVRRQARYLLDLLPVWYLPLLPVAVLAGLVDRRTRYLTTVSAAFAAGWVLVLNNGAFIHDYWAYLVLVPGLIGMAALLDRFPLHRAAAAVAGLVLVIGFGALVFGGTGQRYLHEPTGAGRLAATYQPPSSQEYAYHAGLGAPRWLAYYWDLRPHDVSESLPATAGPADLVIVDTTRLPDWLPDSIEVTARQGRYAVVRVAEIRAAAAR